MNRLNIDGWNNLFTRMGTSHDRVAHTAFRDTRVFGERELVDIYRADGVGRRIVDIPATEILKKWITIEGDTDGDILKALDRLQARKTLIQALKWARLYGGSCVVVGAMDGQDLDRPLDESRINGVLFLRIYGRFQVTPIWDVLFSDPLSPYYGMPELYQISPVAFTPYRVHRSRLLLIDGEDVPERIRQQNNGWGDSSLQSAYDALMGYGTAMRATTNILTDFIQATLSVEGLQDLLQTDEGTDLVKKRLMILDLSRSIINTMLLESGEIYEKKASSVAGLADLIDREQIHVSAATGIPVTKLFTRSPAGLNSTGEADLRNYYDDLASEQENDLRPVVERLVNLVCLDKRGPARGRIPEDMRIVFNPLWEMSEKEVAETRKLISEADAAYIDRGVLEPEEVAISRFGGGEYSGETIIEVTERARALEMALRRMTEEPEEPEEPEPGDDV